MTTIFGVYAGEREEKAVVIAADRLMPKQVDRENKKAGQSNQELFHVQDKKIEVGPNYAFAFAGGYFDETLKSLFPYLRGEKTIDGFIRETGFSKTVFTKHPAFLFQKTLQSAVTRDQSISEFFSNGYVPDNELEKQLLAMKSKPTDSRTELERAIFSAMQSMQIAIEYKSPIQNAINCEYFQELALMNAYLSKKDLFDEDERGLEIIIGTNFSNEPELYEVNGYGIVTNAKLDEDENPIIYKGSGATLVKKFLNEEKFRKSDEYKLLHNTDLHNLNLSEAIFLAYSAVNYAAMPDIDEHGDPETGFEADLVVISKKGIKQYVNYINKEIRKTRFKLFEEIAQENAKK